MDDIKDNSAKIKSVVYILLVSICIIVAVFYFLGGGQ